MDTKVINTLATSGKWRLRRTWGSPYALALGTKSKRGRQHTCPSKQKQHATEEDAGLTNMFLFAWAAGGAT